MAAEVTAHGFTLRWDRCEAVYNTEGELVYAHYIRKGRLVLVHPSHCNVLAWLRRQGEVEMREGSPLRRRTVDAMNARRAAVKMELLP